MEGRCCSSGDQLAAAEEQEGSGISSCPSFNSYSSRRLPVEGNRRDRLVKEFDEDDDDDFEFVPAIGGHAGCDDGFVINTERIGPVFPVFNRDLLLQNGVGESHSNSIMISLRDLFMEEDNQQSSSSEADDELEGIPEGSYCVWTPRGTGGQPLPPSECRKSNSMGRRSSRRWRLLDLVRRSNSDRKESFVLLTPSESTGVRTRKKKEVVVVGGKEGGNRRKSYLPYRKDVVGFLANVNSFGSR